MTVTIKLRGTPPRWRVCQTIDGSGDHGGFGLHERESDDDCQSAWKFMLLVTASKDTTSGFSRTVVYENIGIEKTVASGRLPEYYMVQARVASLKSSLEVALSKWKYQQNTRRRRPYSTVPPSIPDTWAGDQHPHLKTVD